MISIFFDLETTDTNPIGQILNFSFIALDQNWQKLAELNQEVKISRLQLPRPGAIIANRTDVLAHQARASLSEPEAMRQVSEFILSVISQSKTPVPLIGFNSNRFDILHLRTALLRNGLDPYFGKGIVYRDLFQLARLLRIRDPKFPTPRNPESPDRLSLTLESLGQIFGLLEGDQAHNAKADVELSISLARYFLSTFDHDIRTFNAYEAATEHSSVRSGKVICRLEAEYELSKGQVSSAIPMTLLDVDRRYALWIDLEKFSSTEPGRIKFFNQAMQQFVLGDQGWPDDVLDRASRALEYYRGKNLRNYFEKSVCDIEQDIYRLDFSARDALAALIWKGDAGLLKRLKNRDAEIIATRHKLASATEAQFKQPDIQAKLRAYALYRYGGRASMSKTNHTEEFVEGVYSDKFHPTFNELMAEMRQLGDGANSEDAKLMQSLEKFYYESDIYRLAGEELKTVCRTSENKAA